jgi:mannose-1-phosphate guanylyltransferase/mannose-6-phosphate isomerase
MDGMEAPIIVCNEEHRFTIAEQMRELGVHPLAMILEPFARNTAPAVAVSALSSIKEREDAVLLVLPADHVIRDIAAFYQALTYGETAASQGNLVTFGIVQNAAETGYGYIKARSEGVSDNVFKVDQFVEKPDRETAEKYLAEGGYYWNSGMFMFRASRYLEELEHFNANIFDASKTAFENAVADLDFIRLDRESFESCPSESIDYAVMEKTSAAVVVPVDIGWSDIGSWSALWEVSKPDEQGNVIHGDVYTVDTDNCYIRSDNRLVATVGLTDHVIVETADAVLVAHKDAAQDVKQIVDVLKSQNRDEANIHRKAFRPWGAYECIDMSDRFQVKRITVNPGGRLSLQMHHHRAEHWVVVKGTARVTRGDEEFILSENESTYIPLGEKHRLENAGKIPLEIIEVQTGSYLGEDDIVRYDDVYGRDKVDK